ncbi:MAG: hypothetical protein WCD13_20140, partial [Pseudolabrys sp.]
QHQHGRADAGREIDGEQLQQRLARPHSSPSMMRMSRTAPSPSAHFEVEMSLQPKLGPGQDAADR